MNTFFMNAIFYPVWSLINLIMHQQASDIWKKTKASTMLIFSEKDLGRDYDVEIQNLETFQNNFLSPEQVIGYTKAPRRKKRHQRRRKGSSIILTDTPQKEL